MYASTLLPRFGLFSPLALSNFKHFNRVSYTIQLNVNFISQVVQRKTYLQRAPSLSCGSVNCPP